MGRGCDYYELNDAPGCPKEGDYNDDDTGNISVANDNCCHCFGTGVSEVYYFVNECFDNTIAFLIL